jgi:uncharacterized protein YaiE (UPF0345 family)
MFSQDATQGQATVGKSADADYLHGGAAIVALEVMGSGSTGCEDLTDWLVTICGLDRSRRW